MINPFFKNNGPLKIFDILKILNLDLDNNLKDQDVLDIKDLSSSKQNEITFFHSKKYRDAAKHTKASYCITTENLKNELPKSCKVLIVKNVLIATSNITEKFYPNSINDTFDNTANFIDKTIFKD